VALCSDMAPPADNFFGCCALLRCGIIFYAIDARTLNVFGRRSCARRDLGRLAAS
jgi:hypothetical protein